MYDLILCVLATTKNNRLSIFSKIGYKKSNKYKTKIIYLVDSDDRPDFIEGDWINYGRFYSTRFLKYLEETKDESRWFMQVDDDSCTDLDNTIDLLDHSYDYKDPVVVTGSFCYVLDVPRYVDQTQSSRPCFSNNIDSKMQQVLKEMKIENLFLETDDLNQYETMPYVCRGWEQSVFSLKALDRIKNYNRLQEYVSKCVEIKPDFGDQVPFVLAKIAKIPISQCFFLSPAPSASEYTAINKNGRFSHIHHVCESWDQLDYFKDIIENNIIFNSSEDVDKFLDKKIENTEWFFFHIINNKLQSRCVLKLLDHAKIKIVNINIDCLVSYCAVPEFDLSFNYEQYNFEDKDWNFNLEDDCFEISNTFNQKLIFNKIKYKLYGSKVSENEFYLLSKINPIDSVYWRQKKFLDTNFTRIE